VNKGWFTILDLSPAIRRGRDRQFTETRFQGTPPQLHDTQGCLTSGLATIRSEHLSKELPEEDSF
jgi:hypothetical protein